MVPFSICIKHGRSTGFQCLCSCGSGTTTDSNGNYVIRVDQSDSLRFSYLGRATQMFPVLMMNSTTGFDIALHVKPTELSEVRVAPKELSHGLSSEPERL